MPIDKVWVYRLLFFLLLFFFVFVRSSPKIGVLVYFFNVVSITICTNLCIDVPGIHLFSCTAASLCNINLLTYYPLFPQGH